ncbi:hypothetical protein niasHT_031560 [Heterodera trifolii]|uniref:Uncharacterized protein n=1 Tax=Heterodera trifolii TaxID=157864 RepID=A0ABD2J493_9BILA
MPISSPFLTPLGHLFHHFVPPPPVPSHIASPVPSLHPSLPRPTIQQIMHLMAKVSFRNICVRMGMDTMAAPDWLPLNHFCATVAWLLPPTH